MGANTSAYAYLKYVIVSRFFIAVIITHLVPYDIIIIVMLLDLA